MPPLPSLTPPYLTLIIIRTVYAQSLMSLSCPSTKYCLTNLSTTQPPLPPPTPQQNPQNKPTIKHYILAGNLQLLKSSSVKLGQGAINRHDDIFFFFFKSKMIGNQNRVGLLSCLH